MFFDAVLMSHSKLCLNAVSYLLRGPKNQGGFIRFYQGLGGGAQIRGGARKRRGWGLISSKAKAIRKFKTKMV